MSDIGEENGIIEFGSNEAVLTVIAWIGHSIMMDKSDFKLARGVIKDAVNNFSKAKQCSPEYRQQYFVFVEDVFNKIHEFGEKESKKYREDPANNDLIMILRLETFVILTAVGLEFSSELEALLIDFYCDFMDELRSIS